MEILESPIEMIFGRMNQAKMRKGILLLILAITWLSSCEQRGKSTTEKASTDAEKVDSGKGDTETEQPIPDLAQYIYTDTLYSISDGEGITIQNSLPKGGMIDPHGTQYVDSSGKSYAFAVFWTRIVNETATPLELTIRIPADSFAIFTPPNAYLKLLLPSDRFSYQKLSTFNYGLSDIKPFLDANFNKPTELQKTLEPKESHAFYVATLAHQVAGTPRGALILKGSDLYYSMSLSQNGSGVIPVGKIER